MTDSTNSVREQVDKALDWTFSLTIKEAILQNVSEGKKINITKQMMAEAKDEARQTILSLITEAETKAIEETESQIYPYMSAGQRQDYRNHRDATFQNDPRVALKETHDE